MSRDISRCNKSRITLLNANEVRYSSYNIAVAFGPVGSLDLGADRKQTRTQP